MTHDPDMHRRRSPRLKGYDYRQPGAYFVTVCTRDRACLFGKIVDGVMRLNDAGTIVEAYWKGIPKHFPHAILDAFVVMPNHVHGIVIIATDQDYQGACLVGAQVGAQHAAPLPHTAYAPPRRGASINVAPGSLGAIIRALKSATTRQMHSLRQPPCAPIWQRNYYEHIIRDESSLERIRTYICANPSNWPRDPENMAGTKWRVGT